MAQGRPKTQQGIIQPIAYIINDNLRFLLHLQSGIIIELTTKKGSHEKIVTPPSSLFYVNLLFLKQRKAPLLVVAVVLILLLSLVIKQVSSLIGEHVNECLRIRLQSHVVLECSLGLAVLA